MKTHLVLKSSNSKVGKIPITISSKETCPISCPMNKRKGGGGCYAENGPQNIFWTKVTKGEMGKEFKDFVIDIKNLPDGQLFRHNVSGDLYVME